MKTMKKIVAILAVALLLCSILPLSAMAADTTVVFELGADGTASHKDGSTAKTDYTETVDGYTLEITNGNKMYPASIDGKGNGCIKLGTSSAIGSFSFTVPNNVTSVIIAVAKYKTNTTKLNVNGTAYTLTNSSNDGAYDKIAVDTTSNKTVTLTTVSGGVRAMVNSITYVIAATGSANCDHAALECGDTCPECGEYTKEHKFANNCVAECENGCGTANPNYADHVYGGGIYDTNCDVCGAGREVGFPEADTELTIPEADALGLAMEHNVTTPGKYYVTGVVESIADTTYGNLNIQDAEGNKLYIYGTYSADGNTRYDAMAKKPEVGMTITVYGVIGNYNGASQMKSGWVIDMVGGCDHEYEFECSTTCEVCGKGERDVVCVNDNPACIDGLCIYCGGDVDGLGHSYDDEWDPDCNYGCGETREVEEKPEMTEATITFDADKTQRTEYSTTVQKWESGTLVLTNNKGGSTSNVGDYSNPARFYKGSEVIIAYPGMTSLVIDAPTGQYGDPWADTLDAAGLTYTVESGVYTVTFANPVDSITLTTTAQIRANSITATATKQSGDEECEHEWSNATCTAPKTCNLCGAIEGAALGHDYVADIIDATCTAAGTATYECSVCYDSYDEEIPALGHTWGETACDVCGVAKPTGYAPITSADQFVSGQYVMVVETGYAPTYLDGTWVLTGKPDSADGLLLETTGYLWTLTVNGTSVTITDANGVSIAPKGGNENGIKSGEYSWNWSFEDGKFIFSGVGEDTVYLASNTTANSGDNKFRAYKQSTCTSTNAASYKYQFTLYTTTSEPACEHEYNYDCDKVCALCGEETRPEAQHEYMYACDAHCMICYELTNENAAHNTSKVDAVEATCQKAGNVEYWTCEYCGYAWLDEACTQVATQFSVIVPATGEHTYDDEYDADCNVCGDIREVPEKPVDTLYGDADGDGEITIGDAALIQQYLSGYDVTLSTSADADGDGEVTIGDAALIQQYLSGYDVTLGPAEEKGPMFNDGELSNW